MKFEKNYLNADGFHNVMTFMPKNNHIYIVEDTLEAL